jgi:hypothetical protein
LVVLKTADKIQAKNSLVNS